MTRRDFIKIGSAAAVGEAGWVAFAAGSAPDKRRTLEPQAEPQVGHAAVHDTNTAVGGVDHATNGFHPTEMLYAWDGGVPDLLIDHFTGKPRSRIRSR